MSNKLLTILFQENVETSRGSLLLESPHTQRVRPRFSYRPTYRWLFEKSSSKPSSCNAR